MNITLAPARSFHQQGQRSNQEDARFPDADVTAACQRFFVVCDGVGGEECGEVAAATVCESIGRALEGVDLENAAFATDDFRRVLSEAYDALDRRAATAGARMATTLTFAAFHAAGCTMAHIGDSRIYHVRPGTGILYRSDDHSLVNSLVRSGVITPDRAVGHPDSNIITRSMSPTAPDGNRSRATVVETAGLCPGDYFLLCTDGVLHCLTDERIAEILSDTAPDEEKIKAMAAACRNSPDNNTATLVRIAAVERVEEEPEDCEDGTGTSPLHHVTSRSEEVESPRTAEPSRGLLARLRRLFRKN